MGNVLITGYCNRSCPYCFAREAFPRPEQAAKMSLDNLGRVIEFFRRSELKVMPVMGGEPTLHPQFPAVIDHILSSGINVKLFTGGLIPREIIDYLKVQDPERVKVVVNIPAPEDCSRPGEYQEISAAVRELARWTSLGFTIHKSEFELQFLLDLLLDCRARPFIRLGLAHSRADSPRVILEPDRYRGVAQRILRFAAACDRKNVSLGLDCGFTLCMFTPEELGRLRVYNCDARFVCSPIIDIGPELDVWSCYPLLPLGKVRLESFQTRRELVEHFLKRQKAYRGFGVYDACHLCKYKTRGQCAGGCLAQVIRSFS